MSANVTKQAQNQFEKETSAVSAMVQDRIEAYVNASYGIKALFSASDEVSREEFGTYIKELGLRERYPGLVAMYYAPKVEKNKIDAFVKAVRKEGYSNFSVAPPQGDETFIINYIEPYNLYRAAHGVSIETESARLEAMIQACDTGKPVVTDKVTLENAERTDRAFIVLFPIYHNDMPTYTVRERQAAIKGYVGAVFNATSFFQSVIGDIFGEDRISVAMYAGELTDEKHLFFKNTAFSDNQSSSKFLFSKTTPLSVIGNTWTLTYTSLPHFRLPRTQELLPIITLVAGIVFLSLLAMTLYVLASGKRRALEMVDAMTADLRIYADIVKNMTEGLLIFSQETKDGKKIFTLALANPVSETHFKNGEASILGKELHELLPRVKEKQMDDQFAKVIETNEPFEYEDTRGTEGNERTYLTRVFPMPNQSVGIMYVDITEQKEVQETLRNHSEELEKLNKYMVDRELKMVELKKEIARLQGITS